jgi:hypothetical protein
LDIDMWLPVDEDLLSNTASVPFPAALDFRSLSALVARYYPSECIDGPCLSGGAIAGIVIGCLVALLLLLAAGWFLLRPRCDPVPVRRERVYVRRGGGNCDSDYSSCYSRSRGRSRSSRPSTALMDDSVSRTSVRRPGATYVYMKKGGSRYYA